MYYRKCLSARATKPMELRPNELPYKTRNGKGFSYVWNEIDRISAVKHRMATDRVHNLATWNVDRVSFQARVYIKTRGRYLCFQFRRQFEFLLAGDTQPNLAALQLTSLALCVTTFERQ